MRFLLLFFTFFLYSTQFECPSKPTKIRDFSKSYKFQVTPDEHQSIVCQYEFLLDRYTIPTISISNVSLSGHNYYSIKQNNGFATQRFKTGQSSRHFEDQTIRLNMTNTFFLIFEISNNTDMDHFVMEIKFENVTPKTIAPFRIDRSIGAVLDARDLPVNGALEQVETYKNFMIQLVVFNESIDPEILRNFWIYGGDTFEGTLYDIQTSNIFFLHSHKSSRFTIYNRNLVKTFGFSLVFYDEVHLVSQLKSDSYGYTPYILDNTVNTWTGSSMTQNFQFISKSLTFREITDPDLFVYQPTYIRDIRFKGEGKVDIYAGCVTNFGDKSKRIATMTASNYADFENLILYGRCRTFRITDAEVSWTKSPDAPVDGSFATRGALMTYAYPYRTEPELHITWTIGAENVTDLLVQYEFAYLTAKVEISENNDTLLESSQNRSIGYTAVVKSSSQQQVRVNVSAETDGMLIRYYVYQTPRVSTANSTKWLNVLILLFVLTQ